MFLERRLPNCLIYSALWIGILYCFLSTLINLFLALPQKLEDLAGDGIPWVGCFSPCYRAGCCARGSLWSCLFPPCCQALAGLAWWKRMKEQKQGHDQRDGSGRTGEAVRAPAQVCAGSGAHSWPDAWPAPQPRAAQISWHHGFQRLML